MNYLWSIHGASTTLTSPKIAEQCNFIILKVKFPMEELLFPINALFGSFKPLEIFIIGVLLFKAESKGCYGYTILSIVQ